jgi:hypothetical protein
LDEKIPMLGHITQRRTVKTARGREGMVEWLKYIENQAAGHRPMTDYDFGWMWQALGIANLGR